MNKTAHATTNGNLETAVVSRKVPVGRQVPSVADARIEIEKDADQVTRIVIHCSCGEEIIVHCNYPVN